MRTPVRCFITGLSSFGGFCCGCLRGKLGSLGGGALGLLALFGSLGGLQCGRLCGLRGTRLEISGHGSGTDESEKKEKSLEGVHCVR
jgi:hypothetical protein